tara:strand:- start:10818 stop:12443 length:1626 start_codon:yes stop_codon:yes gene_type:complete
MYNTNKNTDVEIISTQSVDPGATVTIGGTSLDPAPFVSLSIEQYTAGELIIGGALNVSLNGTLYDSSGGGFSSMANQVLDLLNDIGDEGDCIAVEIDCGGTKLVDGYGTITSLDIPEGPDPTWTQIISYAINLQLYINNDQLVVKPNEAADEYVTDDEIITDLSETISISHDDTSYQVDEADSGLTVGRSHVKYNFSISATGAAVGCKDQFTQKTGVDAAELVVQRRIKELQYGDIITGLTDAVKTQADLNYYLQGERYTEVRNLDVDPISGSVSVTGDLIIRPINITHPHAFVELTVDHSSDVTQIGSDITINGEIEGLGFPNFHFDSLVQENNFHSASNQKMQNAEDALEDLKGRLVSIASSVLDKTRDTTSCVEGSLLDICNYTVTDLECNTPRVNTLNITRNFGNSSISFSAGLSDASNCNIAGAAKTELEISHTYPTDQFAEFTIPFRGEPLLQNLGTTTKEVIAVSANITLGETGCADLSNNSVINNIISCGLNQAIATAQNEGAGGWYLTNKSVNRSNTGDINITVEYTKPYNC